MMLRRLIVMSLIVVGCDSSDADEQTLADAGGYDGGRADAAPEPSCPADPPTSGEDCIDDFEAGDECYYERCADTGFVRSQCESDETWATVIESCDETSCLGASCGEGTVCTATIGGAISIQCTEHTCGDGPLECDCACPPGMNCLRMGLPENDDPLFQCGGCDDERGCP